MAATKTRRAKAKLPANAGAAATAEQEAAAAEALARAREKLAEKDTTGAFDALLEAWREIRATEIAKLCESLSARVFSDAVSIKGKTEAERLVAFSNAFRDHTPLGLGVCLADFDSFVTHPQFVRTAVNLKLVFPRVDALSDSKIVHDDPRVSGVMTRALPILNGGSTWQKVMLRCFRAIEAAGDPRSIEQLDAARISDQINPIGTGPGQRSMYQMADALIMRGPEIIEKVRTRFPNGVPSLPASLADVVRSIDELIVALGDDPGGIAFSPRRARSTAAGDPESLLQAVYDDPDNDELRLVLADALTERGDPRGEFIVLQVRRHQSGADGGGAVVSAKELAREKQLIKAHGKAWLGPLSAIVTLKSAVFERGFLEHCEADAKDDAMADVHFAHPEWATVRSVVFHNKSRITPAMRALRNAGPLDETGFQQLANVGGHLNIEWLDITAERFMSSDGVPVTSVGIAFSRARFPSLRHLTLFIKGMRTAWNNRQLTAAHFRWLWETPWASQLITLGVPSAVEVTDWIDVLLSRPHLEAIRLGMQSEVVFATLRPDAASKTKPSVTLTLQQRSPTPTWASSAEPFLIASFIQWLDAFEESSPITSLTLEAPTIQFDNEQQQELRQAARRFPSLRETNFPWDDDKK